MIQSMTGYGSESIETEIGKIQIDLKSLKLIKPFGPWGNINNDEKNPSLWVSKWMPKFVIASPPAFQPGRPGKVVPWTPK